MGGGEFDCSSVDLDKELYPYNKPLPPIERPSVNHSSRTDSVKCVRPPAIKSPRREARHHLWKTSGSSYWIFKSSCDEVEGLFASPVANQKVYPMSWGHGEKMNKESGIRTGSIYSK